MGYPEITFLGRIIHQRPGNQQYVDIAPGLPTDKPNSPALYPVFSPSTLSSSLEGQRMGSWISASKQRGGGGT